MSITIRLPRAASSHASPRSNRRKPKRRNKAKARNGEHTERFAKSIKTMFFLFFLSIPFVTLLQTVFAKAGGTMQEYGYVFGRQAVTETVLSGPRWAYSVPFAVENKVEIEKLIQCESAGLNVSGPDSDGLVSDGILQFHRGPADTLTRSTWEDFSRASGIAGSPMNPADAIRMADWAISHGYGPRWTCWRLQKLSP
jgi:hypothetical protein